MTHFYTTAVQIDTFSELIHPVTKIAIPLVALYLGSKVLLCFWRRVLGPILVGEVRWREMGDWVVVAGASYGIGAQYAKELAKRGCNIFIIGHDGVCFLYLDKFLSI